MPIPATLQTNVVEGRQISPIIFEVPKDGIYRVTTVAQSEPGLNAHTGLYLNWTDASGVLHFHPVGAFGFLARILSTLSVHAKAGTTIQLSVSVGAPGPGTFVLRMAFEQVSEG